jgi:tRNA pseudouridine38-40 synthase
MIGATVTSPVLYVCGLVAYDGSDYHGFQVQAGVPTIQGSLEDALAVIATPASRVSGSGRTDAGVHANGQVIAVRLSWRHSVADLQRAWNAHLPPDISLRRLVLAPEGFHPRFSALSRTYRYRVDQYDGQGYPPPRRSPLTERYGLFAPRPLDLDAMRKAAEALVGEHDFATFGQPPQGVNTVRRVFEAEWRVVHTDLPPLGGFPGRRIVFTVRANAFLRQMVRNLVGSLLEVGRGRWSPDEMALALAARERRRSAPPAPPNGLVLEWVEYPQHLDVWSENDNL